MVSLVQIKKISSYWFFNFFFAASAQPQYWIYLDEILDIGGRHTQVTESTFTLIFLTQINNLLPTFQKRSRGLHRRRGKQNAHQSFNSRDTPQFPAASCSRATGKPNKMMVANQLLVPRLLQPRAKHTGSRINFRGQFTGSLATNESCWMANSPISNM